MESIEDIPAAGLSIQHGSLVYNRENHPAPDDNCQGGSEEGLDVEGVKDNNVGNGGSSNVGGRNL